jgi:hypothetical protein
VAILALLIVALELFGCVTLFIEYSIDFPQNFQLFRACNYDLNNWDKRIFSVHQDRGGHAHHRWTYHTGCDHIERVRAE